MHRFEWLECVVIRTEWGGIARGSLTRYSGEGPYRDGARAHLQMLNAVAEGSMPAPASEVAGTIIKAVQTRRPKTRYPTGGGAKILVFLRRVLPDRGIDMMIRMTTERARRSMKKIPN